MNHLFKRTAAYFIDCLIAFSSVMLLIQWLVLSNFRALVGITDEWFKDSWNMEIYVLLTISLPVWIYFTYLDSKRSKGSFGKRIFKLQVRNKKDDQKISIPKSFLRSILKLLPWEIAHLGVIFPTPAYYDPDAGIRLVTIVGIILFAAYVLSIIWDKNAQAIYDRVVGSIVVDTRIN